MMSNYKLCFLKHDNAWFTSASLDDIWGDDWDDAPYEHNAGTPYEYSTHRNCDPYKNLHVKFSLPMKREPRHGQPNSPYSVEDINNQVVPWVRVMGKEGDKLFAGVGFQEFCKFIKKHDGEIYFPSGYVKGRLTQAIQSIHKENEKTNQEILDEIGRIANNVLYFDDSSNFPTALWKILAIAKPELFEDTDYPDLEYIEESK